MSQSSRWLIVSNRLPFRLSRSGELEASSGGLVSAINGIQSPAERVWIGCAPETMTKEQWTQLSPTLPRSPTQYEPIFIDPGLYDEFYNGFCNDVIWPALHYEVDLVQFRTSAWSAYEKVNEIFAEQIARTAQPNDLIWIHDFHFFLLPRLLRAKRQDLKIGFFLHVPFPSSEIFRTLPVRSELLEGLIAADLVGFHDYSYLRHFSSSLMLVLGLESNLSTVHHKGHTTHLGVYPVSIDTGSFERQATHPKVESLTRQYKRNRWIFLGIDRLDYIKGLDLKLKAFQKLLRQHPQLRGETSLIQVAIPSRTGVPEYVRLKKTVDRLVGEINGEFGKPDYTPVQYLYSSVNFQEMLALYRASNALLVTSKRDGMNLVALEYIASQKAEDPGVVILSEFAGALSTLSYALPVNPWEIDQIVSRMMQALNFSQSERAHRHQAMLNYLRSYTATDWAQTFLKQLEKTQLAPQARATPVDLKRLSPLLDQIRRHNAEQLVLFTDYDGTLVPITESPEMAVTNPQLLQELAEICSLKTVKVVVLSGRDSDFLQAQLGTLPLTLVAEHGAKIRDPSTGRWRSLISTHVEDWKPQVYQIMSDYSKRVPGSFCEQKEYSIAWHYRQSPREFASYQAKKMLEELDRGLANFPISILRGKKVIEVRAYEANKGTFASRFLQTLKKPSAALALGDDVTDEDMFRAVQSKGVAVRVGEGVTVAPYLLAQQSHVLAFLNALLTQLYPKKKELPKETPFSIPRL